MRTKAYPPLSCEEREVSSLPAIVAKFVEATNAFDIERLMLTLAHDAIVNDQLREYRGTSAIRDWAARELIGERVTMLVVNSTQYYGNCIVSANIDGDFDKRGLPSPLLITFYFSAAAEKIVQLIILRNLLDGP